MISVIQALVILFTGALDNMVRMPVERLFARRRPRGAPVAPPSGPVAERAPDRPAQTSTPTTAE